MREADSALEHSKHAFLHELKSAVIASYLKKRFKGQEILGIRIFWLIGSYHDDGTNHQLSGLPG